MRTKEDKGGGEILSILILGVLIGLLFVFVVWWAIGTVFGIFGYTLGFWETVAVLIIILLLSSGGLHIKQGD